VFDALRIHHGLPIVNSQYGFFHISLLEGSPSPSISHVIL
jgi:hypothetical protein